MTALSDLIDLANRAYAATADQMREPTMNAVVRDGLSVLYGPPIVQPDLAILSFQGGGDDKTVQTRWPDTLLYRNDPYRFGTTLRRFVDASELRATLDRSTVALPAVFPQAPAAQAGTWMAQHGARAHWRAFSVEWGTRLLLAMRPKCLLVFGEKAGQCYDLEWTDIENAHSQGHMTFARAEWNGVPTIFCHHLSQGYTTEGVTRAFQAARELIQT